MQATVNKVTMKLAKKPIELRAGGKKYGELDQNGAVLVIKRGPETVFFDLIESAKQGHAVVIYPVKAV